MGAGRLWDLKAVVCWGMVFLVAILLVGLGLGATLAGADGWGDWPHNPGVVGGDGPGPTPTPARVWIRSGEERVWIHTLGAPVSASMTDEGIHLQVLNQSGEPAVSAWVEAYDPEYERPEWKGYVDGEGRAEVDVPDGTWTLVVSSANDHFVVVREGVSAPGSLTLDTTGTVPVEVSAGLPDGQPFSDARIEFDSVGRLGYYYHNVGYTDSEGHLQADVSPGTYCGLAVSWDRRTYLNQRGIELAGSTAVAFDATVMGTGQVVMRLSGLMEMGFTMLPEPWCRAWSPVFSMADGESAVLSADRYELGLDRHVTDADEMQWIFFYDVRDTPHDIVAGSVMTVWAGGAHAASVTPRQATYPPGDRVYVDIQVVDDYGNLLSQVSFGPDQVTIPAHMVVRGPQGSIAYEGNCGSLWWCTFVLASDAPPGQYDVEWSLDTGPLQGVLQATTNFSVEGEAVTPTVTPTATSTSTPTATSTPTPTATGTSTPVVTPPARPYRIYLPMVVKDYGPQDGG